MAQERAELAAASSEAVMTDAAACTIATKMAADFKKAGEKLVTVSDDDDGF